MSAPHSLENTLRVHDRAIYNWLSNLRVDYGEIAGTTRNNHPILRVMATPQRAFATVVDLLVYMNWIEGADAAEMKQNAKNNFAVLPLPVITFERGDYNVDPDHQGVPKVFMRGRFNQLTGVWEQHQWPGMWEVPYTLTFWSIKRYTEAYVREWFLSQIGRVGVGDSEVLIPVEHAEPWGTLQHALRINSTGDQSDLEGDEPRYIRFSVDLTLKMRHFRAVEVENPFITSIQTPIHLSQLNDGVTVESAGTAPDVEDSPQVSFNLYREFVFSDRDIPTEWPKAGNATVVRSPLTPARPNGSYLKMSVTQRTDIVDLVNKAVYLPEAPNDRAVLMVAFRYRSDRPFRVNVSQRDGTEPATWSTARVITVDASTSWRWCQFFTMLTESIFDVSIEGPGGSQLTTVYIGDIQVRHAFTPTAVIDPIGSGIGVGGGTKYVFGGLNSSTSYLVVVQPDVLGASQWTIRAEDDQSSPAHVLKRTFDETAELGYAELLSPVSRSIALTLPVGFPSSTVYAQPYTAGLLGRHTLVG